MSAARYAAIFGVGAAVLGACSSARPSADSTTTSGGGADGGAGLFSDGATSTEASCITARATAALAPVNLVFMFDQSGSMGDEAHGAVFGYTKDARWNPITNGLKRFFADASSSGVRASLQYFPVDQDWCDAKSYETPEVALTPLPNATPFVVSLNAHEPLGGTPTLPAVTGALAYAKSLKAQFPNEVSAVVLVTDGEPSDCGTFDEVRTTLAADAAEVKTYVVGVGADLTALSELAVAGGTQNAILVDLQNPQQTSDEFVKALGAIRGQTLSCDMPIPTPPDGKTIDPTRVNVALSSTGGSQEVLAYDPACASADAWRYDDANAPKVIQLCPASCERARVLAGGALEVQLGCATKGLK